MTQKLPEHALALRSTITEDGVLRLSLDEVPVPEPGANEVLVRVEAAPINPSDLGVLFAFADLKTASAEGTTERPVLTAQVPKKLLPLVAARLGTSLPVGNEGAGIVVATGSDEGARALSGKTVSMVGGAMYAQYRLIPAAQVLELPEGTTPRDGAAWFVNPFTALGMVETMRSEGHNALVHTAAASSLGQMLQKVCLTDGIPLVNIVRRAEQADLLRNIGAEHVCNSSEPTFLTDLTGALRQTGATLGFDAIGGGTLANQILGCMEAALKDDRRAYSPYGSTTHKQVYIYGGLDRSPTTLARSYGMAWGVGGWLLSNFWGNAKPEAMLRARQRVANELKTTFAVSYTKEISLAEALTLDEIAAYAKAATGQKYLVRPNKGLD